MKENTMEARYGRERAIMGHGYKARFTKRVAVLKRRITFRLAYNPESTDYRDIYYTGRCGKVDFSLEKGTELIVWVSKTNTSIIMFFLRHLIDGRKLDWYLKPSDIKFMKEK